MARPRRYFAHAVPGLEQIAAGDIEARIPGARRREVLAGFDERAGVVVFDSTADPLAGLERSTCEDVFALLVARRVPTGRPGLAVIQDALAAPADTASLLSRSPRRGRRATFRVVARIAGRYGFRRDQFAEAVAEGVAAASGWRPGGEEAGAEVWAHLVGDQLVAGVRLSDATMRHRTDRPRSLPASLKPTIAAALVLLSQPQDDDVFCDPFCGAGTILLERAAVTRHGLLLGGDLSEEAARMTAANVGPRHKPRRVLRWDAAALPLRSASVDAIVSNLPFGKQVGTPEQVAGLYPRVASQVARVLRPSGRAVLLTSRDDLLSVALERAGMMITASHPLTVLGQRAVAVVARRGA